MARRPARVRPGRPSSTRQPPTCAGRPRPARRPCTRRSPRKNTGARPGRAGATHYPVFPVPAPRSSAPLVNRNPASGVRDDDHEPRRALMELVPDVPGVPAFPVERDDGDPVRAVRVVPERIGGSRKGVLVPADRAKNVFRVETPFLFPFGRKAIDRLDAGTGFPDFDHDRDAVSLDGPAYAGGGRAPSRAVPGHVDDRPDALPEPIPFAVTRAGPYQQGHIGRQRREAAADGFVTDALTVAFRDDTGH